MGARAGLQIAFQEKESKRKQKYLVMIRPGWRSWVLRWCSAEDPRVVPSLEDLRSSTQTGHDCHIFAKPSILSRYPYFDIG